MILTSWRRRRADMNAKREITLTTMVLQRFVVPLALIIGFSGCTQYWEKPGSAPGEFEAMKARCISSANREYPVSVERITTGGGYTPVETNCRPNGMGGMNCTSTGGEYQQPQTFFQQDRNAYARSSAIDACFYQNGWRRSR